ncbi:AIR synthase-related protein [Salinispira pacifica]|uniref:Phosphoribosylformylglycinamidine synthase subunit PurL n=1 Tax=Salinispira pacifica TaxID=1307761 RepID=V5WCF5_9SPIO|nr:AIR synthase-related protein [Salinispira pacifica]AHC13462.1 Phosphoribosylformylglycinamidine synthase, PurS subunit [Salinispira pacifica]
MRIEISYRPEFDDGKVRKILRGLETELSEQIADLRIVDVYLLEERLKNQAGEITRLFLDPVSQQAEVRLTQEDPGLIDGDWGRKAAPSWDLMVEISYKPGVTDPVAVTAWEALELELDGERPGVSRDNTDDAPLRVQTARQLVFTFSKELDEETKRRIGETLLPGLSNPLIQKQLSMYSDEYSRGTRFPLLYPFVADTEVPAVQYFPIARMNDEQLVALSRERLLALSLDEMRVIREEFSRPGQIAARKKRGISTDISDIELEMLAQTWSEHCKHKIFQARIDYRDENGKSTTIDGLFKSYIQATTDALSASRPDLRSVFHDNSGVVDFDEEHVVCFKAETHNSPSALDPYGGAITGIVGVNRDIMGTGKGAKPIFNTNVLCFGHPHTAPEEIPRGLLHPKKVMSGVHEGIIDGGNQSGIPTVAGAFLFDDSYLGKPLVFCGTGGIMPRKVLGEESWLQHVDSGDLAVMLGGRIGKDGIHGATFSSLALDEDSPTSAVQIGDPITQRKMLDFLLEARDKGLYKGITDNGAGGLSSSLGEMAEFSNGIRVDLDKAPLKYAGLAPWEIWVSESQERMSLSVAPDTWEAFHELARRRGVEATVVGEFTSSGFVELVYRNETLGLLPLEFVHNGLPVMELSASWIEPEKRRPESQARAYIRVQAGHWNSEEFMTARLFELLSEPNIRSKEDLVRQYDHEVQGQSVIKPFTGVRSDAPTDGGLIRPVAESSQGLTVTHGVCPRMSEADTYQMAVHAVDEAYRAHIAMGGDPDRASALDNFCWPDPVQSDYTPDGEYKLAQLVRANQGLKDACMEYNLPLISGKDSMKNDAVLGGKKVSVLPTLLVSLLGIHGDVEKATDQSFASEGDEVYLLGSAEYRLGGSYFEKLEGNQLGATPQIDLKGNRTRYEAIHAGIQSQLFSSIHDISDGGLAVALSECCIGGRMGARIEISGLRAISPLETTDGSERLTAAALLFSEGGGRFVVSVPPGRKETFKSLFPEAERIFLGVTGGENLEIRDGGEAAINVPVERLVESFTTPW